MEVITNQDLRERHARLVQAREANQKEIRTLHASLEDAQRREHGFMFVLGELESMVAELNARDAAQAEAEQEAAEAERLTAEKAAQDAAELERVTAELTGVAPDAGVLPQY